MRNKTFVNINFLRINVDLLIMQRNNSKACSAFQWHALYLARAHRRLKLRYLAARKRMIKLLPMKAAKIPKSLHLFLNSYPRGL